MTIEDEPTEFERSLQLSCDRLRRRVDEQKARAEQAEAACAEMRAALIHIRERAASSIGEEESDAIDICDAIERLVGSALGEGDPLTGDLPRRALLAEQTARAERAEVDYRRVLSERAEANQLAGRCAQQRAEALAACAEMRAALEAVATANTRRLGESRRAIEAARALLSRPDLGRGWASPEDTAQMVGALQMVESDGEFDSLHEVTRKFVVDVLALLKRGGG